MRRFTIAACAEALDFEYRCCGVATEHRPVTRDTLIVIPARDEAPTIGSIVAALRKAGFADVVVVDDGSVDGTGTIARRAGATVLYAPLPLGAWGAMQTGIRHALAHGFERVVTMDADGQHEVAAIPRLLRLHADADVVIGAHPARASRARQIAWDWFRRLTGLKVEDLTSGFRRYNRHAMELLVSDEATMLEFQDVGVLLLLRRAGLRVAEVPVRMNARVADRSRVFDSWFTVARYMAATTLLCLARRPYRPTLLGHPSRRSG